MKFLLNTKISYLVMVAGLMSCNLISADPQARTTFKGRNLTEIIRKANEAHSQKSI